MNQTPTEVEKARGLHRFAVLTAGATFCLIFVGGLVTSTGSALAVPDWPLAFGKLIPAWQGGIRFEFGHRVAAGTVVCLTLVLMAWAWRAEPRRWVRRLVMLAFGLIIVQAVLGGITVLFELPLAIAVTHAATAQALFCLMVSIAIFTNPRWETTPHVDEPPSRIPLPTLAAATTAIIYMQILVGALMRHMSAGLVIPDFPLSFGYLVPPYWNEYIAVNFAHRCGAVVVTAMVVWTVARVLRTHSEVAALRRPALGLFLLLVVQICLGAITIWSSRMVIPTTSHVAVGAAVLATSLALTLRAYRILGVPNRGYRDRVAFASRRTAGDGMSAKVAIAESALTLPRGRLSDYFELTKPRVVLMVLVTTLAGFYLGGRTGFDVTLALNLLAGTALAAGGTLALNQYVERDTDAMMDRTRHRPLPEMRMRPAEALTFGVIATAGGLVYLVLATNILCAAVTAAITLVYLGAYTPLKRYTWMCNLVGAIPGALPPVAGWAAARGGLSWEPAVLFAIMFLWQLPHTFAVARLYRTDYARAGIHLLPQDNSRGGNASNPIVIAGSLGLIAVGIIPTMLGFTGIAYAVIASALGVWMLAFGVSMVRAPGNSKAARRLLLASIVYLPIVLLVLVLDRM